MSQAKTHTVLIVDDQEDNLALVARYLGNQGYRTLTASGGKQGLKLAKSQRPDLILLDVIMPDLDGLSVCREIKKDPKTMFTPVILVTTLDKKEDRVSGLKAGADEFLSKPVNSEELMTRVRSLIRLQEVRAALEQQRMADLKSAFRRYVSPKIVERILDQPETAESALSNKKSRVGAVIMFADLRNFTRISSELAAHQVVSVLNEYFSCLTEVAHNLDGTIFNMSGDSMLVGFGVPFPQADSAARAIKCAAEMQDAFEGLASGWPERYGVTGGMGIGVNYGEVVVGNIGSPSFMNYTVVGDTVNLAARLTACAQSGEVIVSERLVLRLDDAGTEFSFERLPDVALKGRSRPEPIFKLLRQGPQRPE